MSKLNNNTEASLRYFLDSRLRGNDEVGFASSCPGVIPAKAGIQEISQNTQFAHFENNAEKNRHPGERRGPESK